MKIYFNKNYVNRCGVVNFRQTDITIPAVAAAKTTEAAVAKSSETAIGSIAVGAAAVTGAVIAKKNIPEKYIRTLAKDLSKELNKEIKASDLKSVMTIKDFLKTAKLLKKENYIASSENIKNGTFIADFHSHSHFSDGVSTVQEILDQAAEYGNKLNKINGKKFLFALSDHDGIGGVRDALKIIAQNPEKYKNVKFIPAAELSMPIYCEEGSVKFSKTKNDVEMAEFLIYGINPFSKHSKEYFENLYSKRKNAVIEAIDIAGKKIPDVKFFEDEYKKFFNRKKEPYCMLNQHWRIFQYINFKTRISRLAKQQNKNPEELYQVIMSKIAKSTQVSGNELDKYFEIYNIPKSKTYLDEVVALIYDICPRFKGPNMHAPYESSFEKIVDYAEKEDAYLAFAHPGFTLQNMTAESMLKNTKDFVEKSNGRLLFAENYHQAYPPQNITTDEIDKTNEIMMQVKLIPIGGRDMHRDNFKF